MVPEQRRNLRPQSSGHWHFILRVLHQEECGDTFRFRYEYDAHAVEKFPTIDDNSKTYDSILSHLTLRANPCSCTIFTIIQLEFYQILSAPVMNHTKLFVRRFFCLHGKFRWVIAPRWFLQKKNTFPYNWNLPQNRGIHILCSYIYMELPSFLKVMRTI
jgi:hypothetical protein